MAERQQTNQQLQSPQQGEDMIACVESLEAALLPCLPARELQAIDRSPHPSHQNKKSQLVHPSVLICRIIRTRIWENESTKVVLKFQLRLYNWNVGFCLLMAYIFSVAIRQAQTLSQGKSSNHQNI
ncbi:hypothetical protein MKW98_026288 [Papaver atlanticum]|uniref:Uncharacterized protein n=1 Tax=Papaver atlanticum TaxID=357466 RepID=A0AAD4XSM3_9MAGN|nr:hypothetical protein MKW98_004851 [Papaver atlanticum]KAI3940584.1 hypothetical protein MKW98_026288 [Papaver atlanticum]